MLHAKRKTGESGILFHLTEQVLHYPHTFHYLYYGVIVTEQLVHTSPSPDFLCATLKNWDWPWDEAIHVHVPCTCTYTVCTQVWYMTMYMCHFQIVDVNLTSEGKTRIEVGMTLPFTYQVWFEPHHMHFYHASVYTYAVHYIYCTVFPLAPYMYMYKCMYTVHVHITCT